MKEPGNDGKKGSRMGVGIAIGLALDNMAYMGVGIALGVAIGAAMDQQAEKDE